MPYLILTANGEEIDRRELTGSVIVGRAPDSGICVRDILLSRRHCRIELCEAGWVIHDLGSKNGTFLGNRPVTRHVLKDGDELRLGRTRMTFRAGAFVPAPPGTHRKSLVRPADPTEALAGTVTGFALCEPDEVEKAAGMPFPQPRPPEPTAYREEELYEMLSEIASSSWDSIMAQNSQPIRMQRVTPSPSVKRGDSKMRPKARVSFALQAHHSSADAPRDARPGRPKRERWRAVVLASLLLAALLFGASLWIENQPESVQGAVKFEAAPNPTTAPTIDSTAQPIPDDVNAPIRLTAADISLCVQHLLPHIAAL